MIENSPVVENKGSVPAGTLSDQSVGGVNVLLPKSKDPPVGVTTESDTLLNILA